MKDLSQWEVILIQEYICVSSLNSIIALVGNYQFINVLPKTYKYLNAEINFRIMIYIFIFSSF